MNCTVASSSTDVAGKHDTNGRVDFMRHARHQSTQTGQLGSDCTKDSCAACSNSRSAPSACAGRSACSFGLDATLHHLTELALRQVEATDDVSNSLRDVSGQLFSIFTFMRSQIKQSASRSCPMGLKTSVRL